MNNFRRRVENSSIVFDPVTGRGIVDGYEVVDLGLSNGLVFATCNVGATKETDYGDYYKYGYGSQKYESSSDFYRGNEDTLASTADTATQVMGEGWRMPTKAELQDLINKTNYKWVTNFNGSGINGGKFTSKTNPNAYVFLPASGYYWYYADSIQRKGDYGYIWSSTSDDNTYTARVLRVELSNKEIILDQRYYGYSVRGVHAAV